MRIKMLTTMAGPAGVHKAGEIFECAAAEARALVRGGFAVEALADPVSRETAGEAPELEAAALESPEETAAEPPARRKRKGKGS